MKPLSTLLALFLGLSAIAWDNGELSLDSKIKPEEIPILVKKAEEGRASMLEKVKKEMPSPAPKYYAERLEKIEKGLNPDAKGQVRAINHNYNTKQLEALYWDIKLDKDFK